MYHLLKHPHHSLPSVVEGDSEKYIALIRANYISHESGTKRQMDELMENHMKVFYLTLS